MGAKHVLAVALCSFSMGQALAGKGPLGIDHRLAVNNDGIWSRHTQYVMLGSLFASEFLSGIWHGGDTRFGRTNWQSIDALLLSAAGTGILKRTFRRVRPSDTDNPNEWFRTSRDRSFPSGEAGSFAAAVTPFILEYGDDKPWVYALAALPAYDGYARLKTRGHWQSDVLAGLAVGTFAGWYSHNRKQSFTLQMMPRGVQVGLSGRF